MNCKFTIAKKALEVVVEVQGAITEDLSFDELIKIEGSLLRINFKKLTLINSCGVREWIKFLNQVKNKAIIYEECPKVLIDQINMVKGFLPINCKIDSFYGPYYSEADDEEIDFLIMSSEIGSDMTPPQKKHPESGSVMVFDDIPKSYFAFLKNLG